MKNVFYFLVIVLFSLAIGGAGCGVGGVSRSGHRGMIEEIVPFDYGDEFALPDSGNDHPGGAGNDARAKKAPPGSAKSDGAQPAGSVKAGPQEPLKTTESTEADQHADGALYRVQIGVFEDQKAAEVRAGEARSKVSENVYVEFEPPFYRVRVGDFKTRKEAEQFAKIMQNNGFRGAFWVMKQTTVP